MVIKIIRRLVSQPSGENPL